MSQQRENKPTADEENVSNKEASDTIVQYIAVRKDLKWPLGALIAQCCHASTAAIHLNYSDEQCTKYLKDLNNMHKIVVAVPNEQELTLLADTLDKNNIKHKLWIEQPENFPTCLAIKPYYKNSVASFFKTFKLFK
jgi:peptidyl-tRNA hydrolase